MTREISSKRGQITGTSSARPTCRTPARCRWRNWPTSRTACDPSRRAGLVLGQFSHYAQVPAHAAATDVAAQGGARRRLERRARPRSTLSASGTREQMQKRSASIGKQSASPFGDAAAASPARMRHRAVGVMAHETSAHAVVGQRKVATLRNISVGPRIPGLGGSPALRLRLGHSAKCSCEIVDFVVS